MSTETLLSKKPFFTPTLIVLLCAFGVGAASWGLLGERGALIFLTLVAGFGLFLNFLQKLIGAGMASRIEIEDSKTIKILKGGQLMSYPVNDVSLFSLTNVNAMSTPVAFNFSIRVPKDGTIDRTSKKTLAQTSKRIGVASVHYVGGRAATQSAVQRLLEVGVTAE